MDIINYRDVGKYATLFVPLKLNIDIYVLIIHKCNLLTIKMRMESFLN